MDQHFDERRGETLGLSGAAGISPSLPRLPSTLTYQGKLVIFSTAYECRTYMPYTRSMVETTMVLERLGVDFDYWPFMGDFHVNRSVNEALTMAMNDESVTDILMIDTDEAWDAFGVLRLLSYPEEIVAGAYRMKNAWERYTCILKWRHENGMDYPEGRLLGDGTALLKAERVPGGFMRIKTSALKTFAAAYPDRWYWTQAGAKNVQFFGGDEVRDHVFHSMDHGFCIDMQAAGVECWIDPNISIDHYGLTKYEGNLDLYLKRIATGTAQDASEKEAFAAIRVMALEVEQRAASS